MQTYEGRFGLGETALGGAGATVEGVLPCENAMVLLAAYAGSTGAGGMNDA